MRVLQKAMKEAEQKLILAAQEKKAQYEDKAAKLRAVWKTH
ncbi:hypothetical protein N836_33315 [Leptolyngbya sp. Heron Island J]|nr:hypothetical protein N836_33315 [Leptolyngbya sp. Heron Island J]